jgi:hypothetical protein
MQWNFVAFLAKTCFLANGIRSMGLIKNGDLSCGGIQDLLILEKGRGIMHGGMVHGLQ